VTRPTLTISLPTFGTMPGGDWRRLLDLARQADDAGIDRIVISDHVVNGPDVASYPWGTFPTGPDADWLEPLTVLTALGAVTERVRLSTGILIAPLRPAALLAKTVATLDVLTAGRLDLGVGTGWQAAEFEALGVDHARRGSVLTDTVAACRALWEHLPASFESSSFSFHDVYCAPQPVQRPLPVWFSGVLHGRNIARVAELGNGWIPIMGLPIDGIAEGVDLLRDQLARCGRAIDELTVRAPARVVRDADGRPDVEATMASVPDLVAIGATDITTDLRLFDRHLEDPEATYAAIVRAFHSAVD
jgi:probable F420-dependent oxidoreductase